MHKIEGITQVTAHISHVTGVVTASAAHFTAYCMKLMHVTALTAHIIQ